jgi:AmiR/NasT family two-component response regulator
MRVLLVEDDVLIGAALAADVREIGFEPVGPIRSAAVALDLVERGQVDMAVLDFKIAGGDIGQLAAALAQRRIPFAWLTGYAPSAIPAHGAPILVKPVSSRRFQQTLTELIGVGPSVTSGFSKPA